MQFILGLIAGIAISTLIFAILAFFRAGIEKRIKIIETQLGNAGPKPRGAILLPLDDADAAREEHIAKNKAEGRDTPISELMNK
jgi:hypothetical protein